jgi:hypothetical protein
MEEEEEESSTTSSDESHNEPESDMDEVRAEINNRISPILKYQTMDRSTLD